MSKQSHQPGPGRSTSDAAIAELKKEIAERNERVQTAARKARKARDQEQVLKRRRADLL